jgi:hypothetical protein
MICMSLTRSCNFSAADAVEPEEKKIKQHSPAKQQLPAGTTRVQPHPDARSAALTAVHNTAQLPAARATTPHASHVLSRTDLSQPRHHFKNPDQPHRATPPTISIEYSIGMQQHPALLHTVKKPLCEHLASGPLPSSSSSSSSNYQIKP